MTLSGFIGAFDLGNHLAATGLDRQRDRQIGRHQGIVLKTQVAVFVGRRRPDDAVVEMLARKEKVRLAAEIDLFDDVLGCTGRDLAAIQIGIDKGADADLGQIAGATPRNQYIMTPI
ncbi:hypothetical protein PhaeoP97_03780 (plasmid) [Phaeobacter porticola]|uniref:Uncharacterized protein n=1 Tax=Phaeobacter porticola TaxID=1844006 RepID=A0A1L3IAD6_9RHOB|nr:hypothetical protein [Phaeobacter porticola]APG49130.1 hypothetical protein PhaeoP97_03780 [Phaeobacter porticola]